MLRRGAIWYTEMMRYAVPAISDLNERQGVFVRSFIEHGDARKAAEEAGYTGTTVRNAHTQLLNTPRIAIAIAVAARDRLARAVPMALNTLEHLVQHAVSERVKVDAAKAILDRAGLVAPRAPEAGEPDKPLNEKSAEELRSLIDKWEGELANRATPIHDTQITG